MSQEIDLSGVKVPAADWEATPESIKEAWLEVLRQFNERIAKLEAENEQSRQRVAQLEEKQRKNSKNSSQPPSRDGFGGKNTKAGDEKSKRRKPLKLKRQEGKRERELYSSEQCQAVYEVKPQVCSGCGQALSGSDAKPDQHQIVEVPPLEPEVVEYRLHQLECEHCGEKTRAKLPAGVSPRCYGERLAGLVGLLSGEYRLSHRQVQSVLQAMFGIKLSRGSINRARQEVSEAVAAAVKQAHTYVQHQPVVNCDETGFAQGNQDGGNPQRSRGWLWVLVTPLVSVFAVALSRSQATAQQLLSATFDGYLGSDRCSSYGWVNVLQRQVCWAHLIRDFQAMAERSGASQEIGLALLRRAYRLFRWWHRVRDGTLSQELFVEAVQLLRVGLHARVVSSCPTANCIGGENPLG